MKTQRPKLIIGIARKKLSSFMDMVDMDYLNPGKNIEIIF